MVTGYSAGTSRSYLIAIRTLMRNFVSLNSRTYLLSTKARLRFATFQGYFFGISSLLLEPIKREQSRFRENLDLGENYVRPFRYNSSASSPRPPENTRTGNNHPLPTLSLDGPGHVNQIPLHAVRTFRFEVK